ncbi:hypothetical protein CSB93_1181 [Pseudomonas paraeruginosa]|uniref:Uncharacterized protein n=1 Tax=Pseudomonas paraeruginosa TaxID=2994495 RepID=A0A2R3IV91_9PSED|nr:hypothetical protein CSB93_1181 [Pseudomonas paraeruginosa]AWE92557.1 hypothetical protein CSC28_6497 [Pseudomonas paraeruginosa]PTC33469.1 hypothetical protein CLJ1_6137 [Pseudomonas aeruginosa]
MSRSRSQGESLSAETPLRRRITAGRSFDLRSRVETAIFS